MSSKNFVSEIQELFTNEAALAFFVFSQDSDECHFVNSTGKELLEMPYGQDHSNLKLKDLIPERASNRIQSFGKNLCEQEGLFQDIMFRKNSGVAFVGNLTVRLRNTSQGPMIFLSILDQTIQKKLQRELLTKQEEIKGSYDVLLEQNKKLKELDMAKNRFIALTTHELRTPMSAILASSEIIKLKLYDNETQLGEFLDMIYEQANQLSTLINDILDFAKIQAGKMDFYISQQDLSPVMIETLESAKTLAEPGKITLNFAQTDTPFVCYFDDVRLKQVLQNILSNAIKYNKDNGSVTISLKETDKMMEVHVHDTGVGISASDLMKVFDEFETLGKVALHHKGTGLGMPISKRLIEGMGGTINLESEVGVGTHFWIEIPKEKVLAEDNYRSRDDNFDLAA